jgi:hypothetical protein
MKPNQKQLHDLQQQLLQFRKSKWKAFYLVKEHYQDQDKDLSTLLDAIEQEDNTLNLLASVYAEL